MVKKGVAEGGDISLGSDAWNVADGYTKIKILTDKRKTLLKEIQPGINLYKSGNIITSIDHNNDNEPLYIVSYEVNDYNNLLKIV